MNKSRKIAVTVMVFLFSIILLPAVTVNAKKLTVNTTYARADEVTGKVSLKKKNPAGYKVKARIAKKNGKYRKKIYTAKVKKTGKFTLKNLPTLKKGWKVRVKIYNKKGKLMAKKVIKVKKVPLVEITTSYYNKVMDEIEDLKKTGGHIDKPITATSPGYSIVVDDEGSCSYIYIGQPGNYLDFDYSSSPDEVTFIALDGATIYGCVSDGCTKGDSHDNIRMPTTTDYDFKITSGQKKTYVGNDFYSLSTYGLYYKVIVYKNGKLIGIEYSHLALVSDVKYFISPATKGIDYIYGPDEVMYHGWTQYGGYEKGYYGQYLLRTDK